MTGPSLLLQTVYFRADGQAAAADDEAGARQLGLALYKRLTRASDDAASSGLAIPVRVAVAAGDATLEPAVQRVLVPVVGVASAHARGAAISAQIAEWTAAGVTVFPVRVGVGLVRSRDVPGGLCVRDAAAIGTPDVVDLITCRVGAALGPRPLRVVVSSASEDGWLNQLRTHIEAQARELDARTLATVVSASQGLPRSDGDVLVALRGPHYDRDAECQRTLLAAKRAKQPILTVEAAVEGWRAPYAGNVPVLDRADAASVWSRLLNEWVWSLHFDHEAGRIGRLARLPPVVVSSRAPELFDSAQGFLKDEPNAVVLHPDPELVGAARQVFSAASPGVRLVTPTSAFRRYYARAAGLRGVAPLRGLQVVLSMSYSPDVGHKFGLTQDHAVDVLAQLWRTLLSSGATLAYGGRYQPDGYLKRLEHIVRLYRARFDPETKPLTYFMPAGYDPEGQVPDWMQAIAIEPVPTTAAVDDPGTDPPTDDAFALSEMRAAMAKCDARVAVGGKLRPRGGETQAGYSGRFPGILEEAYRTLRADKPFYPVGGYGGAAEQVARLLSGVDPDAVLAVFGDEPTPFQRTFDARADRAALGLPDTLRDMVRTVAEFAPRFDTREEGNGLDREENEQLFTSRDPLTIASLVLRGLLRVGVPREAAGALDVELADELEPTMDLDVLVLPQFDGDPLVGLAASLNKALGGALEAARHSESRLVDVSPATAGVRWVYLAPMGARGSADSVARAAEEGATKLGEVVVRYGFETVGVVPFGEPVLDRVPAARATLAGLMAAGLGTSAAVTWLQRDPNGDVQTLLREAPNLQLTVRPPADLPPPPPADWHIDVRDDRVHLVSSVFSTRGTGVFRVIRTPVADLEALRETVAKHSTPMPNDLERIAAELSAVILGDAAAHVLAGDAPIRITHDAATSGLPFELISDGPYTVSDPRVTRGRFNRQLEVQDLELKRMQSLPPHTGPLRVLLVVDPKGDLRGAAEEGKAVAAILDTMPGVEVVVAEHRTIAEVRAGLEQADVLHYCGHAYFDGEGQDQSGLKLADGHLTREHFGTHAPRLRLIVANACESGRVRGETPDPKAFAELLLHSGVEAFVGTTWKVNDASAELFSKRLYEHLSMGDALADAVTEARRALWQAGRRDWANYVQYGRGDVRIGRPSR